MKESIGGTWIFVLVITFLALFTTFVSVSTNYSRCYKIKDEILIALERGHGINAESIGTINEYLKGMGYTATGTCPDDGNCWYPFSINDNYSGGSYHTVGDRKTNYCVTKYQITSRNNDGTIIYTNGPIGHPESAYYGIIVFFRIDWPILNQIFKINVSGETPIIYLVNDFDEIEENTCYR